ncbi:hypothetical protein TcCL_Unassigned04445 [Trypanosoma cruzi]|nr:hypothetical protein TcCL_Unassigned04445 [Trypanosoma cruzi]
MSVLILDCRGRNDFAAARVCGHSGGGRTQKGGMQALRVCVQVPCNNVTTNMLRLGDPHITVVLTNSPGTAHTDALSGRSEASFEALQGTGCVDAATTCMECHDGTVSCGWWNIFF